MYTQSCMWIWSCKHTHLFEMMCHFYFRRYKLFNYTYVYIVKPNVLRFNKDFLFYFSYRLPANPRKILILASPCWWTVASWHVYILMLRPNRVCDIFLLFKVSLFWWCEQLGLKSSIKYLGAFMGSGIQWCCSEMELGHMISWDPKTQLHFSRRLWAVVFRDAFLRLFNSGWIIRGGSGELIRSFIHGV